MKKEDTEMMLRIFETERAGYAYLYPSDGGERKEDYISTTAENIANYIGSHILSIAVPIRNSVRKSIRS